MWIRRPYTLAPLTRLTYIKQRFKWTQVKQDDFEEIKRIVARDTLLTYLDFNESFEIHAYASAFQLGAVIIQKDKYIDSYSRKLTDAQQQYIVKEKELLSIVETLRDFRTILLGQKLRLYTDHNTITCKYFNTDRLL